MKLLFLNTETGGSDPREVSLLSIGMVVWNNYKIENAIELYVKEPILRISPSIINKIDLNKFNSNALNRREAYKKTEQFIYQNFGLHKGNIITIGMDIKLSIDFLKAYFGMEFFNKWFSYKNIDLRSILKFLYIKGKFIDIDSNDEIYKYFNINNIKCNVLNNTLCSVKLFEKIIKL